MAINFIYFKDSDDTWTMHTKNNNVEIIMGSEIIEELFKSIFANVSRMARKISERKWIYLW